VATTFFTCIRPGALRKLTVQQLLAPSREVGQPQLRCLVLAPTQLGPRAPGDPRGARRELTKTGASDETVILDHLAWLGECLAAHVCGEAPTDLLFPARGAIVAAQFGEAARQCGLSRVCLCQLRRGGASGDILSGRRGRKTVRARGQWRKDSSLNSLTAVSREFGTHVFEVMGSLFLVSVAARAIPK
ncbi:unnamed protein product, partial [Prorocentrum cordatum]